MVVVDLIRSPSIFTDGERKPPPKPTILGQRFLLQQRSSSRRGSSRSLDHIDDDGGSRQRSWSLTNSGGDGGQKRRSIKEFLGNLGPSKVSPQQQASQQEAVVVARSASTGEGSGPSLPPPIVIDQQQTTTSLSEGGSPMSDAEAERGGSPRPYTETVAMKGDEGEAHQSANQNAGAMAALIKHLEQKLPQIALGSGISVETVLSSAQREGRPADTFVSTTPPPPIIPQIDTLFSRPHKSHAITPTAATVELPYDDELEKVDLPTAQEPFLPRKGSLDGSASIDGSSSAFITARHFADGGKDGDEVEEDLSIQRHEVEEIVSSNFPRVEKPPRKLSAEGHLDHSRGGGGGAAALAEGGGGGGGLERSAGPPEKPLRKLTLSSSCKSGVGTAAMGLSGSLIPEVAPR